MSHEPHGQEEALGVRAPEVIEEHHVVSQFFCGKETLDDFVKNKALKNRRNKATTTYVICKSGSSVAIGYFSLASGCVVRDEAPKNLQRNMPREIPAVVLGRLAIDLRYQGQGLGEALLLEAFERALVASNTIGAAVILIHAIDTAAADFYKKHGFKESPIKPLTLMHSLKRSLNSSK